MTLHVIAYRSKELLFGMHAFNFNCFLDDFNCIFMQIRCLSVLLCWGGLNRSIHEGMKEISNVKVHLKTHSGITLYSYKI